MTAAGAVSWSGAGAVMPAVSLEHGSACRALWLAVLEGEWAASFDQRCPDAQYGVKRARIVAEARRWFGSRDFFTVCALAGLDGEVVYARWRAAQEGAGGGQVQRRHGRRLVGVS